MNCIFLSHKFRWIINEISINHKSPHEHFAYFEVKSCNFISKRSILINMPILVLIFINFVFLCDHVIVVQFKTFEIVLDVKFVCLVWNFHCTCVANSDFGENHFLFLDKLRFFSDSWRRLRNYWHAFVKFWTAFYFALWSFINCLSGLSS